MKTIFDKVDSKYIDCATGACEHATHTQNSLLWVVLVVALVYTGAKYCYGTYRYRSK